MIMTVELEECFKARVLHRVFNKQLLRRLELFEDQRFCNSNFDIMDFDRFLWVFGIRKCL